MTSNPTKKRKCTVLPRSTVEFLKNWMMSPEHITHPYPTEKEKAEIMAATGIELKQLTNWFVNNRKRFWKPRVEARMQQHLQARTTVESIMSKQSQNTAIRTIYNTQPQQQQQLPLQVHVVNMTRPTISDASSRKSNNGLPPIHSAFQIITNHQTFVPPCSRDDTDNLNSQVVSMGSVSYSSDTDNNSIANSSSSDGNDEETFYNFSSRNQTTPSIKHVQKQDTTFKLKMTDSKSQVVSPSNDSRLSQSTCQKRVRRSSDIPTVQPRSLTFNIPQEATAEPCKKRPYTNDWEAACRNARHGYDLSLPTLEEAAMLFGFTIARNKE